MYRTLRQTIGETYGSESWEPLTGKLYPAEDGMQLFMFEQDVEFDHKMYRCIIIEKRVFDGHSDDVDYAEDVYFESWEL